VIGAYLNNKTCGEEKVREVKHGRVDKGTMTYYTRFGLQNGGIFLGGTIQNGATTTTTLFWVHLLLPEVSYHSNKSSLILP